VAVPRPLRHLDGMRLHLRRLELARRRLPVRVSLRTGPDSNREMVDVPEVALIQADSTYLRNDSIIS
jgi:hypothetical protein